MFERIFERTRLRRPEEYRDISRVEKAGAAEKTPKSADEMTQWYFLDDLSMSMTKFEAQIQQLTKALTRLKEALAEPKTDIVRDSAIQRFEFTLDLSWKAVKTFLEEKKGVVCASPKECFREAYRHDIIAYEAKWLAFVDRRNETVHTYNEEIAEKIYRVLPDVVEHVERLLTTLTGR